MKSFIRYLLPAVMAFGIVTTSTSCDEEGNLDIACIIDIGVESLGLIDVFIPRVGEPLRITCVLKNVVNAASGCGESGESSLRVTCAYSPTFHQAFSDYDEYDTRVLDSPSLAPGESTVNEQMDMGTPPVPGYYAIRVESMHPEDINASNDVQAFSIRVD